MDGVAIAENNARWQQQDRDEVQIRSQCNATMTTTMTTKGADDHKEEDPPPRGENT